MKVSVESTKSLEKRVKVEVEEIQITSAVQDRLLSMTKTVQLKGFRRGKAPIKVIQKHYGTKVRQEVIGDLVQDSLRKAIVQEKLQLASRPELEDFDPEQMDGFTFTAKVEILPEIILFPLEELIVEKIVCHLSDNDVDKMVELIRQQHSKAEVLDRMAAEGDVIVIDFVGYVDGQSFAGGSANDVPLYLGGNSFIPGFEAGLIGVSAGDNKLLKLKFPDDYANPDLASKDVEFQVEVKTVKALILPDLDHELFVTLGVTEGGLEEFKAEIRKNMMRESEQIILNRLKESTLQALYVANKLELPPSMVTAETQRLKEKLAMTSRQQGTRTTDIPPADPAVLNEQAGRRVALQLLVTEIVKRNDLKAEASAVRIMIEKLASSYQEPAVVVDWYYADKDRLVEIESLVLEQVVVDWILQRSQVKETVLSFDALTNKRQTHNN